MRKAKVINFAEELINDSEYGCDDTYNFTKEEFDKYALELVKQMGLLEYKDYIFGKNYFKK